MTDLESEARLNASEELLRELINTGQRIFYFQAVVLLQAATKEELDLQTKTTLAKVREINGAEAMAETVGTFKVWKLVERAHLALLIGLHKFLVRSVFSNRHPLPFSLNYERKCGL